MTPSNAVLRKLWVVSEQFSEVTDLLDGNEGYPFIHIKESYDDKQQNSELIGTVTQIIDVWGLREQRDLTDNIVAKMHNAFMRINDAFEYSARMTGFRYEQLPENITGSNYIRYRLEVDILYTKKGGY